MNNESGIAGGGVEVTMLDMINLKRSLEAEIFKLKTENEELKKQLASCSKNVVLLANAIKDEL